MRAHLPQIRTLIIAASLERWHRKNEGRLLGASPERDGAEPPTAARGEMQPGHQLGPRAAR